MKIKPYQAPEYTQVRNAVIDYIMPELSPAAWKILMVIIRQTWGWHKETERISLSQLAAKSGLTTNTIRKAVDELIEGGHIFREGVTKRKAYEYSLNLDFEIDVNERVSKIDSLDDESDERVSKIDSPEYQELIDPISNSDSPEYQELIPQKKRKKLYKEKKEIWAQILSLHMGDPIGVRNAYAGTELAEIADGYLLIYYPNAKSMEWSRRRLRHLEEAVAAVLPGERQIRMEVRDERGD